MKIFKTDFDANSPATFQINVPEDENFGIGIRVKKDNDYIDIMPENVTVTCGNTTLSGTSIASDYVVVNVPATLDPKFTTALVTVNKYPDVYTGTGHLSAIDRPMLRSLYFDEQFVQTLAGKEIGINDVNVTMSDGTNPNLKIKNASGSVIATYYFSRGYVYDSVTRLQLTSYVIPDNVGSIYVDSTTMNQDITGVCTVTIGDRFSANFRLSINTYNATVFDIGCNGVSMTASSPLVINDGNISLTADYADNAKVNSVIDRISTLSGDISVINSYIPNQTTHDNQLADKNFVNSSIATNTATFRGTVNSIQEMHQLTATNNDYAFVKYTDDAGNTLYNRYKYNGTSWLFEYGLNNSSFTANQWASINSGITGTLVAELTSIPNTYATKSELTNMIWTVTEEQWSELSSSAVEGRIYFVI